LAHPTYEIDTDRGLARVLYEGPITADDFIDVAQRVTADPRYRTGMPTLGDFRRAEFDAGFSEVVRVEEFTQRILVYMQGATRWAAVASEEPQLQILRLFLGLHDHSRIEVRIFDDPAAAEAWLLGEAPAGGPDAG